MRENTVQKVKAYISDTEMLMDCDLVIAGISGGPDSMTMLHILNILKKEKGFALRVVHVNHGIRGEEALRDQQVVEKVCADWDIPCSAYAYDVPALAAKWKMGTEEAGRKVRREAFAMEKSKSDICPDRIRTALAHNKNDMAETMLHHLARGTGIRGLCSLKPVNGEIIHPLLCLERCEIVDYIKKNEIVCVTDSSNLEDEYTRNRIRRHILPLLEREVNPRTIEHMAEASVIFGQAETYFAQKASILAEQYRKEPAVYLLDETFFEKEAIIRRYVIREILEKVGGHQSDLTAGHIRQIEMLKTCTTGKKIMLPYSIQAIKCYEGVRITQKRMEACETDAKADMQEEKELAVCKTVSWGDGQFTAESFSWNKEKICEKKYTKWFDCDKIKCKLSVRTRRSGDYMIVDSEGSRKKLTRCMIDDKIPAEIRHKIPLIAAGDEILWIVGGRMSERYKITSHTGRVLQITYQGGKVQ